MKMSTAMSKSLVILLALAALTARADTFEERYGLAKPPTPASSVRPRPSAPTASAAGPSEYRIVTNHVFNVPRSVYWKPFKAECQRFLTNGIIMQEVIVTQVYETRVPYAQSIGAYGAPPTRHVISETRSPGKKFLLRNCPASLQPSTGKEISGKAMQDGTVKIGQEVLEVWDYGRPIEK